MVLVVATAVDPKRTLAIFYQRQLISKIVSLSNIGLHEFREPCFIMEEKWAGTSKIEVGFYTPYIKGRTKLSPH